MTETRIRVDREMIERASAPLKMTVTRGPVPRGDTQEYTPHPEQVRKALEAALAPHLERRKGERRDIKTSSSESTETPLPTCGDTPKWDREGYARASCTTQIGCLVNGQMIYWWNYKTNSASVALAAGEKPRATQDKPKTPPTIHISQAMRTVGGVASADAWKTDKSFADCAEAVYRAMELKRLEEQQNPDLGLR